MENLVEAAGAPAGSARHRRLVLELRAVVDDLLLVGLHQLGGPIPLGGTSNHFRTYVLQGLGGWDPHNVTEDADLGLRLVRFGYRTETIACPTYEAGPDRLSTWLPPPLTWMRCAPWSPVAPIRYCRHN